MLSNGRRLSRLAHARRIAQVGLSDFMIGVPLYADVAAIHDFVVQAKGAFEETIFGILNLARVGIRIELRIIVHRETYAHLPRFAQFVARNLPFVDQVTFMGLELTGYARSNLDALWIDPFEYQNQLEEAVDLLDCAGIHALIFNHPLCVLSPSLHSFSRQAISDWKNIYFPECGGCGKKADCGGFFASSSLRHSEHIKPF
jgi:His-Xaa-Ser system radical SAM maturase HxsC